MATARLLAGCHASAETEILMYLKHCCLVPSPCNLGLAVVPLVHLKHSCPVVLQPMREDHIVRLQNAIRKKSEQLNYMKLSSRLDAVVSKLDTQAKMSMVNKNFAGGGRGNSGTTTSSSSSAGL